MIRRFQLSNTVRRDPEVDIWFEARRTPLGVLAQRWFSVIRACGDDVEERLHDGHPTACVGGAAFAEVNVFTAHVNVGLFVGPELPDPAGLLRGTGQFMRHIQLRPGVVIDEAAVTAVIQASYTIMRAELGRS